MTEEWVDCTEDYEFKVEPTSFAAKGDYYLYAHRICGTGRLNIVLFAEGTFPFSAARDGFRAVYTNGCFHIERRIEKNFCLACGQEVKK